MLLAAHYLLKFRPPALPVQVQAPVAKGLEGGSQCPGHFAGSPAQLLLLHMALPLSSVEDMNLMSLNGVAVNTVSLQ